MKFAVLGDIHGNLHALKAILSDLKSQGITKYLIAGDLIADCNYPNEVLELIQTLDAIVIKGNREEYVLEYLEGLHPEWDGVDQMASVVWTALQLTPQNISYLQSLPMQQSIEVNGTTISMVHGSPFNINEHLYEDSEPERLVETVSVVNSQVLICAHSHRPWKKIVDQTLVLNPGAAGVHFNSQSGAEYAILEVTKDRCQVTHHVALYDLASFKEEMFNSSLYEVATTWVRLIVQSIEEGFNANIEFLKGIFSSYEINGFISNEIWKQASNQWYKDK